MTPAPQIRLQTILPVACPAPAEAVLFPVSGYPIPEPERDRLLRLTVKLSWTLAARSQLSSEIFLHIAPSKNGAAGAMISPNARDWMPQVGLGVWPARRPPALWTKEDFANLEPGQPPPDMVHPVFRVSKPGDAREKARATMFGTGAVVEVLTRDASETVMRRGTELLRPSIQEPAYQSFPFYFPLLDAASIAATPHETLKLWFCGGSVYMRESIDDTGVLLISLLPLRPILDSLGAKPHPQQPGSLQFSLD